MITIDKTDKSFPEWRFVLSAYDKKHSEFDVIQVTGGIGGTIIATDGKRLHRIVIQLSKEFETGYYKVLKNTTKEIWLDRSEETPSDLWKQCNSLFDVIWNKQFSVWRPKPGFYAEILTTLSKYNIYVSIDYLKDLEKYSTNWLINFDSVANSKQLYFVSGCAEALIMSFNPYDVEIEEI